MPRPFSAHGQSFHVSIWYVALKGINDPAYVEKVTAAYDEHRETTVLRHVLKHLRQRRLLTPFQSIIDRSGIQLENPLLSKLHESLVLQGDWTRSEQLLCSMSDAGLFTDYLNACQPRAIWNRLTGTDADGDVPSPRGGHAMCLDPEGELIYLYGGWDGRKSLDDFWVYSIREDKWKILSHSTENEPNAPGPRSCHKMVFDSKTGNIYLLGRVDDSSIRLPSNTGSAASLAHMAAVAGYQGLLAAGAGIPPVTALPPHIIPASAPRQTPVVPSQAGTSSPTRPSSEFYRYQTKGIDAGKWVFLSFDTAVMSFASLAIPVPDQCPGVWWSSAHLRSPNGHRQRVPDYLCFRREDYRWRLGNREVRWVV